MNEIGEDLGLVVIKECTVHKPSWEKNKPSQTKKTKPDNLIFALW